MSVLYFHILASKIESQGALIRFNYHVNALELKLVWHPQNSLDTPDPRLLE